MLTAVVLSGGVAWSVLDTPYLVTNDGPQHSFVAYVANHLADGGWADSYRLNTTLTSNGYHQIVTLLEPHLGLEDAHQTYVLFAVLLWAWCWFLWLRHLRPAGSLVPLIAFPAALQWTVWIGLYPFLTASALIPVALWMGDALTKAPGWRRGVALTVLLLLIAYLHAFAAMIAGSVAFLLAVVERRGVRGLVALALSGVPVAGYVLIFASQSRLLESGGGTAWEFHTNVVSLVFEDFLPGPAWHRIVFACLSVLSLLTFRGSPRIAVGVLVVATGVLFPVDLSGWELIKQRLVPLGTLLVVSGLRSVPIIELLVGVVVVVVGADRVVWAHGFHERLYSDFEVHLRLARHVSLPTSKPMNWALVGATGDPYPSLEETVVGGSGILHLTQAAAPHLGGTPFFSHHADESVHHIIRTTEPGRRWLGPVHPPTWISKIAGDVAPRTRELSLSGYIASLTWLDALVIVGKPSDRETIEDVGYRVEREVSEGETNIYVVTPDLESCTWHLFVDGPAQQVTVLVGFGAEQTVRDAVVVDTNTPLELRGLPCGPSWLSVDLGCEEARQNDRLYVLPRTAMTRCTLRTGE
jgi:hypothetical protein